MKKKAKNKFEKIRRINDLTQTEESKIIGVSPHHISEFENAIKDNKQNMPISLSLIVKISTLYNVPIDYFFSDESRFSVCTPLCGLLTTTQRSKELNCRISFISTNTRLLTRAFLRL